MIGRARPPGVSDNGCGIVVEIALFLVREQVGILASVSRVSQGALRGAIELDAVIPWRAPRAGGDVQVLRVRGECARNSMGRGGVYQNPGFGSGFFKVDALEDAQGASAGHIGIPVQPQEAGQAFGCYAAVVAVVRRVRPPRIGNHGASVLDKGFFFPSGQIGVVVRASDVIGNDGAIPVEFDLVLQQYAAGGGSQLQGLRVGGAIPCDGVGGGGRNEVPLICANHTGVDPLEHCE